MQIAGLWIGRHDLALPEFPDTGLDAFVGAHRQGGLLGREIRDQAEGVAELWICYSLPRSLGHQGDPALAM